MQREALSKYNNDPSWRAAYDAALAKAAANGVPDTDAVSFAETAADLAVAEAAGSDARRKADLAATRARLATREAAEAAEPAKAEARADDVAQAALKDAVAKVNAGRGHSQPEASEGADQGGEVDAKPWAKAVDRINANRGTPASPTDKRARAEEDPKPTPEADATKSAMDKAVARINARR